MGTRPQANRRSPLDRLSMPVIVYSTLVIVLGAALGLGLFTFGYANGAAYFGTDPATCAQCHAMEEQYTAWTKGGHRAVAGCNDCHAPHDNIINKYVNKAENGFWHSLKFTTGNYPENIEIREHNRRVTEDACVHCHGELVHGINSTRPADQKISCLSCHSEVGHMR